MDRVVPMQDIYCSSQDFQKICSLDLEVIDKPTTPLLHRMSRFWLINEGRGVLKLQGREYDLAPGTMVAILPWQISDVIKVESPLQYYLLAYYFDDINDVVKLGYHTGGTPVNIIEELEKNPVVRCGREEYQNMQRIFRELYRELGMESAPQEEHPDRYHDLFLKNKLVEVMLSYLRIGEGKRSDYRTPEGDVGKSDILRYMYRNLSQKLTLKHLAKLFFMSESSISAYIRQTTGLNFSDLLNEMRVGKTINFLLYTNLTMEELAEILGFVDSSHICKVFAARVGMKANDFRKTYQNVSQICDIRLPGDAYKIVSYIYRNYGSELTPQNTAEHFRISTKELNTILLYQVEKNFPDFLNYVRINRASELLKNTELGVLDIALEVGYHSAKTFTRNFLKFRTMTPAAFRQNIAMQKNTL
ncbi:MAG: helix-turn-helix domain-containing protein [Eubacteriales bacterium]|nr:helix-turn-helix domain-containing protein [Eubacteriales bacterium]